MRPLNPQSVSLLSNETQSRLDCGQLRLEPAITVLDWLFTPNLRLEKSMHGILLQASTRFYPRFTLPKNRSNGFGSYTCDSWHFHTTLLVNCELSVSLRLPLFGLALPHTHTPWHVIQNVRCTPEGAHLSITIRFHALLTPWEGYFSAFPHGTIFAIGLTTYLGLEIVVPQFHASFPRHAIQDTYKPSFFSPRGLSPSMA